MVWEALSDQKSEVGMQTFFKSPQIANKIALKCQSANHKFANPQNTAQLCFKTVLSVVLE
jgi:hypothetical protein